MDDKRELTIIIPGFELQKVNGRLIVKDRTKDGHPEIVLSSREVMLAGGLYDHGVEKHAAYLQRNGQAFDLEDELKAARAAQKTSYPDRVLKRYHEEWVAVGIALADEIVATGSEHLAIEYVKARAQHRGALEMKATEIPGCSGEED